MLTFIAALHVHGLFPSRIEAPDRPGHTASVLSSDYTYGALIGE